MPPLSSDLDVADKDIFRLLSRAPRRGFWVSALAFTALLAIGVVACFMENALVGVLLFVLAVFVGTGHIIIRNKLNAALWIIREPAAVYWAEPRQLCQRLFWTRRTANLLTLHTPAPVRLEALLAHDELITVLRWLRERHPDVLIGSFSPTDSGGRLSGNDPWSPRDTSGDSAEPTQAP